MVPVRCGLSWQSYIEDTPSSSDRGTLSMNGLWEQIYVTRDSSDYLCYMTKVNIAPGDLKNGQFPLLAIMSAGLSLNDFINGPLVGTIYGGLDNQKFTFSGNVKLGVGINKISLLCVAVGLPNVGLHFEKWNARVLSSITLSGLSSFHVISSLIVTVWH